jgi:microcystin-dependent protein
MSEAFLSEIRIFGFNFPPKGWAFCNGQILPIAQNQALFSLLGVTYGGNGVTTFALPNLQTRVPMHFGQGLGLSAYALGQTGGLTSVTLTAQQMPAHVHGLRASNDAASTNAPSDAVVLASQANTYTPVSANITPMAGTELGLSEGGQPHQNLQPYLGLNFCMCLTGVFPSRN